MSQETVNKILNDIYKTNRLMDDRREATSNGGKEFESMLLETHMRCMEGLNEIFDQTNRWEGYFAKLHPMTVEVRISGYRDKQNR